VYYDWDRDGNSDERVRADANGQWLLSANPTGLGTGGTYHRWYARSDGSKFGEPVELSYTRETATANPTMATPVSQADYQPQFCACSPCPEEVLTDSPGTQSPVVAGVRLANGQFAVPFPLLRFATRGSTAALGLHYSSLETFAGSWGNNWTLNSDWQVTRLDPDTAIVRGPDGIAGTVNQLPNGAWQDVSGLFGRLEYDADQKRWRLTFPDGRLHEFFEAPNGQPGRLLNVSDRNGNKFAYHYNEAGNLVRITTDGGQEIHLAYTTTGRLASITDPLSREFRFLYDAQNRLIATIQPETEFADIAAGELLTDTTLAAALVTKSRMVQFAYTDPLFPNHLTSVTDERGAVVRSLTYDAHGRVATQTINGRTTRFIYEPTADPAPLPKLEPGNLLVRTIDPEGNVVDTELVGPGQVGQLGSRRRVTWTRSGLGLAALRPGEPLYWEQRWQQDCDCLAPTAVSAPFSSTDKEGLTFDAAGLPNNWPRTTYTYNQIKQVLAEAVSQGSIPLRTEFTYQPGAYGDNHQYARQLTRKEPRAFSTSPLHLGQHFTHTYEYDMQGNLIRHAGPTVTRGVPFPQTVVESWTYDEFGRQTSHTDPNGNRTEREYYNGPVSGGGLNTAGEFGGYLKRITRGAAGSADAVTSLTTTYKVNALGWITRTTDPAGHVTDATFNALGELVSEREPEVTLFNGQKVRYETRHDYDGAGNRVLTRRSNQDHRGVTSASNPWIDRSCSYDAGNLRLAERVEVDGNDGNDLITLYAYDGNQQLSVVQRPEGNRTFTTHDERGLCLRQWFGVAPGDTLMEGYPTDKSADSLTGATFLSGTLDTYDARGNPVQHRDGRGFITDRFFDFANRQVAESDPNGNGWRRTLDESSHPLTEERGVVSKVDGQITQVQSRRYRRFDQLGRPYQVVDDINLGTIEATALDPTTGGNPNRLMRYDAGSRTISATDANGNTTMFTYDAANRRLSATDALGNVQAQTYDLDSNVSSLSETEVPGPGTPGEAETYVTEFGHDELNRRTLTRVRGRTGGAIDHQTRTAFDSLGYPRKVVDAEGNTALTTRDDANRVVRLQWFAGDPDAGGTEQRRFEHTFDRNGRMIEDRTYSDLANLAASAQVTRHAYDDWDRLVRSVYPDSDDPIDGSGNGADSTYDRIERQLDPNSNPTRITEQRLVVFNNTFDPGNRLTDQLITLPPGVPGPDRQEYCYDALNRLTSARNNFAKVDREYDVLSRMTAEVQSIKLDGTGFGSGWEQPIRVESGHDRQSNRTSTTVKDGALTDLNVSRTFDQLNRVDTIAASYFGEASHPIAGYHYFGPGRTASKTLGNGATLTRTFDDKRRPAKHVWHGPAGQVLVGFGYSDAAGNGYDRVDNPLYEQFFHDDDRFDHRHYNKRYELTGVDYRSASATPPANFGDVFAYNDSFNRTSASFGDPFNAQPNIMDAYTSNPANEYTRIVRNSTVFTPAYDPAGNMTSFPVRPLTTNPNEPDVMAAATWDAFNNLHDLTVAGQPKHDVRNDPFNRPVVVLDLASGLPGSVRQVYDGWKLVTVRKFNFGATLASAPSTLDAVHVHGPEKHEPLLTAIDRDQDRLLGWSTTLNERDTQSDQHYYLLNNGQDNVMALSDATDAGKVLEFYRYTATGEQLTMARKDANLDRVEDTPEDLADNVQLQSRDVTTEHGNRFGAGGMVTVPGTSGVLVDRGVYYEPRTGQQLQRTPGGVGGAEDDRDIFDRFIKPFGSALYKVFLGWFVDPIVEFVDRYGPKTLFLGIAQGVIALVTLPMEIFESMFYSFRDMRRDIIQQLDAKGDVSGWVLDRFYENRETFDRMRTNDPERYAKIQKHFGSDLHWRFGYFMQWLTGEKILAWEAMNIWPSGGLTGIEDMGTESVALANVTCAHDSMLSLRFDLGVGPGGGFGREGNVFSGMVSTFLRVTFSGDYGSFGFGGTGMPGVDRPWGSKPSDKLSRSRIGFGGWSILDQNYDPLSPPPPTGMTPFLP
jgi:YD repeat-containing protein